MLQAYWCCLWKALALVKEAGRAADLACGQNILLPGTCRMSIESQWKKTHSAGNAFDAERVKL